MEIIVLETVKFLSQVRKCMEICFKEQYKGRSFTLITVLNVFPKSRNCD
jgi:hypothetical protein